MVAELPGYPVRILLACTLTVGLAACSILNPQVAPATRSAVKAMAHPGMKMSTARANIISSGYRCQTRSGSWFDENGEEHPISGTFTSCMQPTDSVLSFACGQRPHVVLVPNGSRVARVIVDMAPACTNTRATVPRRPQDP